MLVRHRGGLHLGLDHCPENSWLWLHWTPYSRAGGDLAPEDHSGSSVSKCVCVQVNVCAFVCPEKRNGTLAPTREAQAVLGFEVAHAESEVVQQNKTIARER